jgi:hypothetical protein
MNPLRLPRFVRLAVLSAGAPLVLACALGGLLVGMTGCAHVAAYERGTLAHPTMTADDTATEIQSHVRAISEGASGGLSGGGGGCGCN